MSDDKGFGTALLGNPDLVRLVAWAICRAHAADMARRSTGRLFDVERIARILDKQADEHWERWKGEAVAAIGECAAELNRQGFTLIGNQYAEEVRLYLEQKMKGQDDGSRTKP